MAVICLPDRKPWYPILKNMFITSGQIVVLPKSFRVRFLQSPELMEWMFAIILRCLFFFGNVLLNGKKKKINSCFVSTFWWGNKIDGFSGMLYLKRWRNKGSSSRLISKCMFNTNLCQDILSPPSSVPHNLFFTACSHSRR